MLACFIFPLIGAVALINAYPNRTPPVILPLFMVAGFAIGGAVCWKLGRSLNRGKSPGRYHTLYSVRIEHWGVVYFALATLVGMLLLAGALWKLFR
jgi:hypothetical protein